MLKKIAIATALVLPQLAMAGVANFSVTTVVGTGSSVGVNASVDNYVEAATGMRHLYVDGVAPGDYSHRHENYSRASASTNTDVSVTTTAMAFSGTVTNATRIGESDMDIVTFSHTDGVTTNASAYVEVGTFTADEVVGSSYSVEAGSYVASGTDVGVGVYSTDVATYTDAMSSYGIYGAN